jgi:hypothetical protein
VTVIVFVHTSSTYTEYTNKYSSLHKVSQVSMTTRGMDKPRMCNDLGETVTQDTDQRCDQENVGHANEDKLDDGQLKISPRTGSLTMRGGPSFGLIWSS